MIRNGENVAVGSNLRVRHLSASDVRSDLDLAIEEDHPVASARLMHTPPRRRGRYGSVCTLELTGPCSTARPERGGAAMTPDGSPVTSAAARRPLPLPSESGDRRSSVCIRRNRAMLVSVGDPYLCVTAGTRARLFAETSVILGVTGGRGQATKNVNTAALCV